MKLVQEFDGRTGFHRLVNTESGAHTAWAPYTSITLLDGMVGVTAFYAQQELILTPLEFVELTAVKQQ